MILTNLIREAQKVAYMSKNIKSAFETTGIVPNNPRTALGQYSGTDLKSMKASNVTHDLPTTPGNTQVIRHLEQQVRSLIDNPVP